MSVTQGLAELKLLDKRLRFGEDQTWIAVSTKTSVVDVEKLKRRALAEYQSYMALVARRDTIKRAIVMSNATTQVKIGTWTGTVAEAIEYKSSVAYKITLLDNMKTQLLTARTRLEVELENTNSRLDRLLSSELGKDVRTNPDTIGTLTTSFRENNKVELIDPLDLASKVRDLEAEIDAYKTNVDWVLSETNGRTMIQV